MNKLLPFLLALFLTLSPSLAFAKDIPPPEEAVIGINQGSSSLEPYGVFWSRNGSESFKPSIYDLSVIGHEEFPGQLPPERELRTFLPAYLKKNPSKKYFEFWNEMNTHWSFPDTCEGDPNRSGFVCFKSSAKTYAALLKVFSSTIRQRRPDAVIALGSLADSWPEKYLEFIYQAGGKDDFDVVTFTPEYVKLPDASRTQKQKYPELAAAPELKGDTSRRGTRKKIQAVEAVMDKYGDSAKKIWIGETGYSLVGDRAYVSSIDQQIDYLVRAMILSFSEPKVERFFLYSAAAGGIEGDYQLDPEMYHALPLLSEIFSRFRFQRAVEKGDSYDYIFREKKGRGIVHFAWSLVPDQPFFMKLAGYFKTFTVFGEVINKPIEFSPRPIMLIQRYIPRKFSQP